MPSKRAYIQLTVAFLFMSLVSQLSGFVTPWWLQIRAIEYLADGQHIASVQFSLWYAIFCYDGDCVTKSYVALRRNSARDAGNDFTEPYTFELEMMDSRFPFTRILEYAIEASIALGLVFIAFAVTKTHYKEYVRFLEGRRSRQPRPRFCLNLLLALASGVLVTIPVARFVEIQIHLRTLPSHSDNVYYVELPYALICSGVGGVLAFVAGLTTIATMAKFATNPENRCTGGSDVTNDDESGRPPIVPLLPLETQTTSTGFTDPVMPGYVSNYDNYISQGRHVTSELNDNRQERHQQHLENSSLLNNANSGDSEDRGQRTAREEQPSQAPPSYEEVMSQYTLYKPP